MLLLPMHLLLVFVIVPGAIHSCDPQTQYDQNGKCCKKCGPGTRMSIPICEDPQCTACVENEYQDGYTQNTKCKRQSYCDPNLNFEFSSHKSKIHEIKCVCQMGFHCSSKECFKCVPHTTCKPGERVQSPGNHSHDTVCQKCPEGTFSTSMGSDCESWTVCDTGSKVITMGTDTSDTICEQSQRKHVIIVVIPILILLALLAFVIYIWKVGHSQAASVKSKVKDCVGNTIQQCKGPLINIGPFMPVEDSVEYSVEDKMVDSMENKGDMMDKLKKGAKTPEESDDPNEPVLTDKGNVIAQEDGKREALSRQESHSLITLDESVPLHTHGHGMHS